MPDFGRAKHEKYRIELPSSKPEYPALPWTCTDATMINAYFEVRKEILLDWLPRQYGRTTPAYCRLFIVDNFKSPAGAFRDATLALGCRLSMMPAAFTASSITNNRTALAVGIFERGYPNAFGKIDFEADKNHAHAIISDEKGPLLEITLPLLQMIEPSRLAYDHVDAIKTHSRRGRCENRAAYHLAGFQSRTRRHLQERATSSIPRNGPKARGRF